MNPEHSYLHGKKEDRAMGDFFDTPDPCKVVESAPPFDPCASSDDNGITPLAPPADGGGGGNGQQSQSKGKESEARNDELTPLHPAQSPVKKSWDDFVMESHKIGDGVNENNPKDVLRLMEALAYLGYYSDTCEYNNIRQWSSDELPSFREFSTLSEALRKFQIDNNLKSKNGAPIRDGAVDKGFTTFKKLNEKIREKREESSVYQKIQKDKKDEADKSRATSILCDAIESGEDKEINGGADARLVQGLKEAIKGEIGVFRALLGELESQNATETAPSWDVHRLLSAVINQLNNENWFQHAQNKDEQFQQKVEILRNMFLGAAFKDAEGAKLYASDAHFLERFTQANHSYLESYVWAEEEAAVEIIAFYLPRLDELKCLACPASDDPKDLNKAKQAQKQYDKLAQELVDAHVVFKGIYAEKMSGLNSPVILQDLADRSPISDQPVNNAVLRKFDVALMKHIGSLDEEKRDYVLNYLAKGKNSELKKILARSGKQIRNTEGLGKQATDHMATIAGDPGKALQQENQSDPAKIINLHPNGEELQGFLAGKMNNDPELVMQVLARIPEPQAGKMSFNLLMSRAEGGNMATLQAPIALTFYEKIRSGRDSWWSEEQARHYPAYLTQLEQLLGLLPDNSCGNKGNPREAQAIGQDMQASGYWVNKKHDGNPAAVADFIAGQLTKDWPFFKRLLNGQGELKGAEFEQDLFHRIMIKALVDEQVWEWKEELIHQTVAEAERYGLSSLKHSLSQIPIVKAEIQAKKQTMGYAALEQEESNVEGKISALEQEKRKLQQEINDLTFEKPPVERGLAGFASEGNSFEETETVHWPGGASGVTLGKGIDFKYISDGEIALFTKYGVPEEIVNVLIRARGKTHQTVKGETLESPQSAQGFVANFTKRYPHFKLTAEQQTNIYNEVYAHREQDAAARLRNPHKYTSLDAEEGISQAQYDALPDDVKQFFGDLRFQGSLREFGDYPMAEMLRILKEAGSPSAIRAQLTAHCRTLIDNGADSRRAVFRWLLLTGRIIHFEAADAVSAYKMNNYASPEDAYAAWKKKAGSKKSLFKANVDQGQTTGNSANVTEVKNTPENEPNLSAMTDEEFIKWYTQRELSPGEVAEQEAKDRAFAAALQKKRALTLKKNAARIEEIDRLLAEEQKCLEGVREQREELDGELNEGRFEFVDGYLQNSQALIEAHSTDGVVDTASIGSLVAETAILKPEIVGQIVLNLPDESYRKQFLVAMVNQWYSVGTLIFLPSTLRNDILEALGDHDPKITALLTAEGTARETVQGHAELRDKSLSQAPGFLYGPWLKPEHFKSQSPDAVGERKLTDEELFSFSMAPYGPGGERDIQIQEKRNGLSQGCNYQEAKILVHWKACQATCFQMLVKGGFQIRNIERHYPISKNQKSQPRDVDPNDLKVGLKLIDQQLKRREPVIVGVDTGIVGQNLDASDHFVVIVGKVKKNGKIGYAYFDPGTKEDVGFDLEQNVLWISSPSNVPTDSDNYAPGPKLGNSSYALSRTMTFKN